MQNRLFAVPLLALLSIAGAPGIVRADPTLPLQVFFGPDPAGSFVPTENVHYLVATDGGQSYSTTDTVDLTKAKNPAPEAVYQVEHYGHDLTYNFSGFKPGKGYTVRLHFAETFFSAGGSRVFDALINQKSVLKQFDIFKDAGGKDIADVQQFDAVANGTGNIVVELTSNNPGDIENAKVNGIEILASAAK